MGRGGGYEGSEILQRSKCLSEPPKTRESQVYSFVLPASTVVQNLTSVISSMSSLNISQYLKLLETGFSIVSLTIKLQIKRLY